MSDIRLAPEDAEAPWAEQLRVEALESLERAENRLGIELKQTPLVESIGPETAFYEELGRKPHNIMAVAIAGENRIVINRVAFMASGSAERRRTLTHEFAHLLLGRRVPGGVPRWLDEGLAMIASDEHSWTYHTRLMTAATFSDLASLDTLFQNAGRQELDYAQSLSATRFLIELEGSPPDDPLPLVRKLSDYVHGEHLRNLIRNPRWTRAFENQWRDSLTSFWSVLGVITSGSVLWLMVSGLFLLAWWRKRRMAQQVAESWEEDPQYAYGEDAMWMYHSGGAYQQSLDDTAVFDEPDEFEEEWYWEED